jgi:hypothetical protein
MLGIAATPAVVEERAGQSGTDVVEERAGQSRIDGKKSAGRVR